MEEDKDMMQLAAGGVAFALLIALAGFLCIALVVAAVRSVILSNV